MSASSSAGDASRARNARSDGSTAVSRPPRATAIMRAPDGPGISMRSASGRRNATSARLRPRRSGPRTDTRRLPDQDGEAAARSATPGAAGRKAPAQAAAAKASASTPTAREPRTLDRRPARAGRAAGSGIRLHRAPLLSLEYTLGITDLGLHARTVELAVLVLADEGLLPQRERLGHAAAVAQDIGEVVEDDRALRVLLGGLADLGLGLLEPAQPEERPAEAVAVGAAAGVEVDRLLDELERLPRRARRGRRSCSRGS